MKRAFTILMAICAALALVSCDDGGSDDGGAAQEPVTYAIGDIGPSGVGIVFYVTDGGLHGLEAAPVDQSTGAAWSNVTSTLIGTTEITIGKGSANTEDIIGQSGHTASAAQICRNYRATEEGDWFLPSIYELEELYDNRAAVGGFSDQYYWSSSEIDKDGAQRVNFNNSEPSGGLKSSSTNYVRAVRVF